MNRIALALAAATALTATPALADGFKDREVAFQVLNAADTIETCVALGNGRAQESNPFLGKHPSCGTVVGFKLGAGVLHYAVAKLLTPKQAKVFQIVTIVGQGAVVAANLRFAF